MFPTDKNMNCSTSLKYLKSHLQKTESKWIKEGSKAMFLMDNKWLS